MADDLHLVPSVCCSYDHHSLCTCWVVDHYCWAHCQRDCPLSPLLHCSGKYSRALLTSVCVCVCMCVTEATEGQNFYWWIHIICIITANYKYLLLNVGNLSMMTGTCKCYENSKNKIVNDLFCVSWLRDCSSSCFSVVCWRLPVLYFCVQVSSTQVCQHGCSDRPGYNHCLCLLCKLTKYISWRQAHAVVLLVWQLWFCCEWVEWMLNLHVQGWHTIYEIHVNKCTWLLQIYVLLDWLYTTTCSTCRWRCIALNV